MQEPYIINTKRTKDSRIGSHRPAQTGGVICASEVRKFVVVRVKDELSMAKTFVDKAPMAGAKKS